MNLAGSSRILQCLMLLTKCAKTSGIENFHYFYLKNTCTRIHTVIILKINVYLTKSVTHTTSNICVSVEKNFLNVS